MLPTDPAAPVVLHTRVVTGSGGGPDKTILNNARFLGPAGYRVLCAYMHPPDDPEFDRLREKARHYQSPLISVPDRGAWDCRVVRHLLRICREEKVAIWHGHDYKSNALGVLLRRFWPMRLVTTVHGWGVQARRTTFYYWIDRLSLRFYERVVCVSEDLQRRCVECGVPADRCLLIENAIDAGEFARKQSAAEAKARLGIPPERLVIGAVGRLSPEKAFDLLLRAVGKLLSKGYDLALVIVGEGDERPRLEALRAELGLGDRVHLLGYRSDTADLYQAMDVYALSSLREGLPNVLLEAMATELPVAATRIAGVPRLVRDGENGLLIEPGSVEELAGALGRLVDDAELRSRLGQAGRRLIESSYSLRARMDRIRAIYDSLLGRPTAPLSEPACAAVLGSGSA